MPASCGLFLFMDYQKALSQLRYHEGEELFPYRCSEGYLTIGVGRNIQAKPLTEKEQLAIIGEVLPNHEVIHWLSQNGITPEQSEMLLYNDYSEFQEACHRLGWLDGHNGARQAAIINMAFNLGITGVLRFKRMLVAWKKHDYETAAKEALDSRWRMQVGRRARELAEQIRTGEWQ